MRGDRNIRVEDLWFRYRKDWILRGINMDVRKGEVLGIVGPNGSGKTTLSKHFNRLLEPERGSIYFRGEDITDKHTSEVADRVGYVFQSPESQIFSNTVEEEIAFGPGNLGLEGVEERVQRSLEQVGLGGRSGDRTAFLTRGDKQRVAIASVLALQPDVLVLDEPSAGLDYRVFWEIMSNICTNFLDDEKSVVVISHDSRIMDGWADRIVELRDGKIVGDEEKNEFLRNNDYFGREKKLTSVISQ